MTYSAHAIPRNNPTKQQQQQNTTTYESQNVPRTSRFSPPYQFSPSSSTSNSRSSSFSSVTTLDSTPSPTFSGLTLNADLLSCAMKAGVTSAASPPSRSKAASNGDGRNSPPTTVSKNDVSVKKIPRPPNSFLIYRKEHAAKYAGLVATELSTKLAQAWKKETPERRAHYANLAEKAKQDHAIQHPNYKFKPIPRGTGKRALALKAMANAAKKAAEPEMANPGSPVSPTLTVNSVSSSSSTRLSDRPRRSVQRPQRFSSDSLMYSYTAASSLPSAYSKRPSMSSISTSTSTTSPSLFFHPYAVLERSFGSPSSSTRFSSLSSLGNDESDLSDMDAEGEYENEIGEYDDEEDDDTRQISDRFGKLLSQHEQSDSCAHLYDNNIADISFSSTPAGYGSLPTPPLYSADDSLPPFDFSSYPYPPLLSIENFEPECLARDNDQWMSMSPGPNSLVPITSTSFSFSSNGYMTPTYDGCPPHQQQQHQQQHLSMEIPIVCSSFPSSTSTTTMPSVACLDAATAAAMTYGTGTFLPFMVLNEDMTLSPALSTSSSSEFSPPPVVAVGLPYSIPEASESYFANDLEWM
ncbi:Transcription factor Sox-2 [Mortierella sp. GBA30]|nr:Transcription factor Sox-2 [Mortierella sp. GBA30]